MFGKDPAIFDEIDNIFFDYSDENASITDMLWNKS